MSISDRPAWDERKSVNLRAELKKLSGGETEYRDLMIKALEEKFRLKIKVCGNCKNYVGGVSWPGDTQVCLLPDPPPSDWMAPDWDNLGFFGSCQYFQPKESSEKPRVPPCKREPYSGIGSGVTGGTYFKVKGRCETPFRIFDDGSLFKRAKYDMI